MVRGRYVIENDQILFSSQHGLHAGEIKQFALEARSHPRPVCTPTAPAPSRPHPPARPPPLVSRPSSPPPLCPLSPGRRPWWQQPECVAVEWNQNRVAGPAETAEWRAKDAVKKAAREEENAKKKAEREAQVRGRAPSRRPHETAACAEGRLSVPLLRWRRRKRARPRR